MSINFDLFNSTTDVDTALNSYSDEELIGYLELDLDFTEMELTDKLVIYNTMVDNYPNNVKRHIYTYFFNKIKTRLENYLDINAPEPVVPAQPKYKIKQPKKLEKRHTLVINSDKRANRNDPTTSFEWELSDEISNVKSLYIESYNIPKTWYNISNKIGNNIFGINYLQPLKFYFTAEPSVIESEFISKSPFNSLYNTNFDNQYKNWFNENIVTQDIGAGLIRDHNGRPYKQFPDMWDNVTWNVQITSNPERFTISYTGSDTRYFDISYREFSNVPGSTFNYILIRDVLNQNTKIQDSDFVEDTSRNIYFLIKRDRLPDTILEENGAIVQFLNNRTPYNYRAIETDPRGEANFEDNLLLNYEELLSQFEEGRL